MRLGSKVCSCIFLPRKGTATFGFGPATRWDEEMPESQLNVMWL